MELRRPADDDYDWVVSLHGKIYEQEFGWNDEFRLLVQSIVDAFKTSHDPATERGWIAYEGAQRLGCVFLVRDSSETAKLRILLVEPSARGRGVGARLVDECLRFARSCGYARVTLWTNSNLTAARRIYEAAGFTLEKEEKHQSFGKELLG